MYAYKASVLRVLDGDTIHVTMDLGFHIHCVMDVRIKGVDTPELSGPYKTAAQKAKAWMEVHVKNTTVWCRTTKGNDKYGRYLAETYMHEKSVPEPLKAELAKAHPAKQLMMKDGTDTYYRLDLILIHLGLGKVYGTTRH